MGQIKYVGSLIMAGLFGVALILFAFNFAIDNETAYSLADTNNWANTNHSLHSNFSGFHENIVNASDQFYQSEIQEGETVRTGGQFKLGPATALATVTTIISQGFESVFGSDNAFGIILTALLTFLGTVLFLLIWKTWAGRNPE